MKRLSSALWSLCLLLVPAQMAADQYDDAIASIKRKFDSNALETLRKGPAVVDEKILTLFDQLGRGFGTLPRAPLDQLLSVLSDRYYARWDQRSQVPYDSDAELANVVTVLRLRARTPVYAGSYFSRRGGKFYLRLLDLTKGSDPGLAKAAKSILRETVYSRKADNLPGDPALIRLFRRSQEWTVLGMLRDAGSIPAMRRAMGTGDRKSVASAISGLSLIPDYDAPPLFIPHLADADEVRAAEQEGKFGTAYWALRRGIRTKHVPLLRKFLRAHDGVPRAYAVNLLGYFGRDSDIQELKRLQSDRHPRVRAAAYNAVQRLLGKLPDPHDTPRWSRP